MNQQQTDFLLANYQTMTAKELQEKVGYTNAHVRSFLAKKGLSAKRVVAKKPHYAKHRGVCPITMIRYWEDMR